jgi:osmotically inducible lipoprotein OsmB
MRQNASLMIVALVSATALTGCGQTEGQRATSGALLGGTAGALIGGATTHTWGGAAVGGALGAAGGAIIGAATAPRRCVRYAYDYYGNYVCTRYSHRYYY